jgi:hypothetical protein
LFIALCAAMVMSAPRGAWATSCRGVSHEEALAKNEVVMAARVVAYLNKSRDEPQRVDAIVERVYKGKAPERLVLRGGGMKGASFTVGELWLVFVKAEPEPWVHLCSGSFVITGELDPIFGGGDAPGPKGSALLAGEVVEPPPPPRPATETSPLIPATPIAGAPEPVPATPATLPAPPSPGAGQGGCAGCTVARRGDAPLVGLLLSLLLARRRRAWFVPLSHSR